MRKRWHRAAVAAMTAAMIASQGISAAAGTSNAMTVSETSGVSVEYLTIQSGETQSSVNLNWYAPDGTETALVQFGDQQVQAQVRELTAPTKLDTGKYTDTGKMVCTATVSGLTADTSYTYRISYDGGQTWSAEYTYATAGTDGFKFGFTSDPQIKEDQSHDDKGWNSSDGTNQTGWATMMEKLADEDVNLVVSAGDQVEDQSWGKSSEYAAFFAPEEMTSIPYAPAVGNHDRHYMFEDHFNLPNEMSVDGMDENGVLKQVKTTFRGQNSGTSQSHGNYIQATDDEIASHSESNGITPNAEGQYDFVERREMETKGNYYYLYDNVLFVTLNTGAYPGGNDEENAGNESVPSASKDNSEAKAMVENFRTTLNAATEEYAGQYDWLIVTHHKSTQTVAKHAADSDIENYVDAGFEKVMDEFDVDFVLGGHDHVYSRSYVIKDGERNAEKLDTFYDPDGTIYLTGNCCSDMQYYTPFDSLDKENNADYPVLANGETGSQAYLEGKVLPYGNQEWNQEYSPSYAVFDVQGDEIFVNVYNLAGDSVNPDSELIDSFRVTKDTDGGAKASGAENGNSTVGVEQTARYDAGMSNADGGVMEIVDYNTQTGWAYAVNGQSGYLTAIPVKDMESKETVDLLDGNDIDIRSIVEENCDGFTYGDMTSVSVSEDGTLLVVAVQAEGYTEDGRAVVFRCNEDGTLSFEAAYVTGVQPDMVTFTPDGSCILTANEGEPREGYGEGTVDPEGSVTVIELRADPANASVKNIGFTAYDSTEARQALTEAGIVLKKGANPSADFEPEYIAAGNDVAYVTLQEANAIAVLDLNKKEITGIYSAGYEDYSTVAVDIDKKDEAYSPKTYESLRGIRMPDGIALYTVGSVDYLVTANEGDSREWGDYLNEDERDFGDGETSPSGKITAENSGLTGKVVFFDSEDYDGLEDGMDYLFGGRSFTVFRADESGLTEVYDSGSEFETKIAAYVPDHFNCSNDDVSIDDRSGKKGPEVESVTTGTVGDRTYAFVGLERVGGVMIYDITDPENTVFANYINSRDYSENIAGDDSPEGLSFIPAADSADGNAYLLAACEVSGTVAAYQMTTVPGGDQQNPGEEETPGGDQQNPGQDQTPGGEQNPGDDQTADSGQNSGGDQNADGSQNMSGQNADQNQGGSGQKTTDSDTPKTGDTTMPAVYGGLALAALLAAVAAVRRAKSR